MVESLWDIIKKGIAKDCKAGFFSLLFSRVFSLGRVAIALLKSVGGIGKNVI